MDKEPKTTLAEFTMRVTFDATQRALFERDPVAYIKNEANLVAGDEELALKVVDPVRTPAEREEASRQVAERLASGCWPFPKGQSWTAKLLPLKIDIDKPDHH